MNDAAETPTSSEPFALPASLTIETVEDVLAALKERAGNRLTLDASATESLSTPGAQLLLSLAKRLTANGGALTITGEKPAFSQAFEQLGLASHFAAWRPTNG